jgi:hypothetical protein
MIGFSQCFHGVTYYYLLLRWGEGGAETGVLRLKQRNAGLRPGLTLESLCDVKKHRKSNNDVMERGQKGFT